MSLSEPIFVENPNATSEDDGVLLVMVLADNHNDFLSILERNWFLLWRNPEPYFKHKELFSLGLGQNRTRVIAVTSLRFIPIRCLSSTLDTGVRIEMYWRFHLNKTNHKSIFCIQGNFKYCSQGRIYE